MSLLAMNVVVVLTGTCCYQIFNSLKLFFLSQPIVIKFRIQIVDNILYNHTMSDIPVKS